MQTDYYKLRSLDHFERVADIIVNKQLYCSGLSSLNDPMEGFFHAHIKDRGFSTLYVEEDPRKICSLSGSISDIKLWAHYADDHRGIAIKFLPDRELRKVTYSNQLYTVGSQKHTKHDELLTKLEDWEYEDEFRYISEDETFLKGEVTGIIFGIRTPTASKALVQMIAQKLNIPTYSTKLNTKNYKIEIEHNQSLQATGTSPAT